MDEMSLKEASHIADCPGRTATLHHALTAHGSVLASQAAAVHSCPPRASGAPAWTPVLTPKAATKWLSHIILHIVHQGEMRARSSSALQKYQSQASAS